MGEPKPTLYLDKGVFGSLDLFKVSESFKVCYSEATLLDLRNDLTSSKETELRSLNEIEALYLYRDGEQISCRHDDALALMNQVDHLELDAMTNLYRFLNGGGSMNLLEVFIQQLTVLRKAANISGEQWSQMTDAETNLATEIATLSSQSSDDWHRERQKATKPWSQDIDVTLREVLSKIPGQDRDIMMYFPESVPSYEYVQLAAMLLGVLQLGTDRGILSADDVRSQKAARNGYVDCLHIMFGLHCNLFLTSDRATFRRFRLLNDYWQLERQCGLVSGI